MEVAGCCSLTSFSLGYHWGKTAVKPKFPVIIPNGPHNESHGFLDQQSVTEFLVCFHRLPSTILLGDNLCFSFEDLMGMYLVKDAKALVNFDN